MPPILKKIFHYVRPRTLKFWLVNVLDPLVEKHPRKVIFIVKSRTIFSANHRATCEYLLKEKVDCEIAVFAPGGTPPEIAAELSRHGVRLFESFSLSYLRYLLRSSLVFVSHSIRDSYISSPCSGRVVVNYWHGATYKKIENRMGNLDVSKEKLIEKNAMIYDYLVASCKGDQELMSQSFGVTKDRVLPLGLPRYDLLKDNIGLLKFSQKTHDFFNNLKSENEQVIMYAPTFRESVESPLASMPASFLDELNLYLAGINCHLVIRPHYYDKTELSQEYSQISMLLHWDHPETNMILSMVDLLIVDYSSIWIDYLLTDRPIIFLQLDYDHYSGHERGLNYERDFLPGELVSTYDGLQKAIDLSIEKDVYAEKRREVREYFHDYCGSKTCTEELISRLSGLL